jgi:hypothetical protein
VSEGVREEEEKNEEEAGGWARAGGSFFCKGEWLKWAWARADSVVQCSVAVVPVVKCL